MKYIKYIFRVFKDLGFYIYLKMTSDFPKVLSINETLDLIILNRSSFTRFGDGEFNLISLKKIGFQEGNQLLASRLKEILVSNETNCLICVPGSLESLKGYSLSSKLIFIHLIANYYNNYKEYLLFNKKYPNSFITRPYMDLANKSLSEGYFIKFKQLWAGRNIIIIEGENTKLGIGNDLFDNANSIRRIITLSINAFSKYDELLITTSNLEKDNLILVALGPTATVLAYDLAKVGYQVADIGHLDIEYEWFLKQAKKKIKIKGKHVNELGHQGLDANLTSNRTYESQILFKLI